MPLLQTLTFGSRFNQPLDKATWVDVEGVVAGTGSGNSRVGLMLASISYSLAVTTKNTTCCQKELIIKGGIFCFLILTWILPQKVTLKDDGWKTRYFSFSGHIRQLFMGVHMQKTSKTMEWSHKMSPTSYKHGGFNPYK